MIGESFGGVVNCKYVSHPICEGISRNLIPRRKENYACFKRMPVRTVKNANIRG